MTCTIGKLRGVRYAAFQWGAARGVDDAQPVSSFYAILHHIYNTRFDSVLGTVRVAAPITTSAALHHVTPGRQQAGSNQRPNQRRSPRQQDARAHDAGQPRGQPRQGGGLGGERPRGPQAQPWERGGGQPRGDERRGWAPPSPLDAGSSASASDASGGGGGGRELQLRGDRARDTAARSAAQQSSVEQPLPRQQHRTSVAAAPSPALQRWDLVAQNAPQRVFNLIGDPRSGVADDTTINPFGEVTVDLVHHQPSNEVYWFKYEFAGRQMHGAHRDARLSDYTRNLMYLLRAKDPKRWTIPALADKFKIRRQRVLAILALKELEAQRLEAGKLLPGPLSAYSLPVYLQDVHLDPVTGEPSAAAPPTSAAAPEAAVPHSSGSEAAAASQRYHVDVVLPQVLSTTHRLQSWLLEVLREHEYDIARLRERLISELQQAEELAAKMLGEAGEAEGSASYLREELVSYRTAIEGVVAAVEGVVSCSPLLLEERRVASLRANVESALTAGGDAVAKGISDLPLSYSTTEAASAAAVAAADGLPGGGATVGPSMGMQEVKRRLEEVLGPVLESSSPDDNAALQRLFFSLAPASRAALLRLLPDLAATLNAAGADLARATKDAAYRGPAAAAAAAATATARSGGVRQLEVDVFGFAPVASQRLEALTAAVEAVEAARGAVVGKVKALGSVSATATVAKSGASGDGSAGPPLSTVDLLAARSLVRQFVAADCAWFELLVPSSAGGRRAQTTTLDPAKKRRALEVLTEADPSAVSRALQVEAALQLRSRRSFGDVDAMAAGVGAAAAAEAEARGRPPPARPGDRASWDALAAYLDVRVAGKVYGSGSGERLVTHMPSYPAFEGYSLDELDRATEGELSALNRKVAERLDAEMYDRFRQDLLYNLGVRGEKLRRSPPGQPPWPTNLLTALERPVVVYEIAADGATQYPPLYVANGDGTRRPLNDQEKVFQERRSPRPRLPYYMGRISRVPELE